MQDLQRSFLRHLRAEGRSPATLRLYGQSVMFFARWLWMAELGQPFDAWDLVQLGVPDPDDPHRWGGLFRAAAQAGLIESVGNAPSRRPTAADRIARVWRGTPAPGLTWVRNYSNLD